MSVTRVRRDGRNYETVAASQTDQVLGGLGATGDDLDGLWVVPSATTVGAISIKDGGGSAITVYAGTAAYNADLKPFWTDLGVRSTAGAWKVTTGAGASVIAVGRFT